MFTVIITLDKHSDFDRFDKMIEWCDKYFKDFTQINYDVRWLDKASRKGVKYDNCTPWEFTFMNKEDKDWFLLTWK